MRRHLFIIFLIFDVMTSACSGNSDQPTPTPTDEISNVICSGTNITADGATTDISFNSTSAWTASTKQSWCALNPQSGEAGQGRISVTIAANESTAARTATVSIKAGKASANATIKQDGKVVVRDYQETTSMSPDAGLLGKGWEDINDFMRARQFDYTEHPNKYDTDHIDGTHCEVLYDDSLRMHVFKFKSHASSALDGDRGEYKDRQRNEMKSSTGDAVEQYSVNGNYDEWQRLEWKMRITKGFLPTTSFCHIHQLKGTEGDNVGSPLITITLRADKDKSNRRVQVIHTLKDGSEERSLGKIVDNVALEEFENEWVQVSTETHFAHIGYYSIKMTRIRDNKVLLDYKNENIDMWCPGTKNIRSKYGIYRSFGGTLASKDDKPANGIKDETLQLADFHIFEANPNTNPQTHD